MATGRGWVHQQYSDRLQRDKIGPVMTPLCLPSQPRQTNPQARPCSSSKVSTAFSVKAIPREKKYAGTSKMVRKSSHNTQYMESIPSEILHKILSYLDPISLLCIGSVNKRLYQLSNDNLIWYKFYSSLSPLRSSSWKLKSVDTAAERLSVTTVEDKLSCYWKNTYINQMITGRKTRICQILKSVNKNTGIPANIEKAVKMSGLIWAINFKDRSGKENVIEQMDISYSDTSLTVVWYGLVWPSLGSLAKLQLHGVTPVLFDKCMFPTKNGPRRCSLIAECDLRDLRSCGVPIGEDTLVRLIRLSPNLLLGLWKKGSEIAFVMATLHYHQLLEMSTFGSANSPYIPPPHIPILDDIDSEYGLHGYQLHIDMHSGPRTYLCGTFRGLYCRKDYIRNGFLRLTVIGLKNNKQHAPLAGNVGLFWRTDTFEGNIQNCFMMDITVLDETEKPFWCTSAPVNLQASKTSDGLYDFMGQNYYLCYEDSMGKVHIELVWMKETEEYYIVNLVLYLRKEKVNSWFGTYY
ncbi:hypothetical protein FKM82_006305 [Ascaphus truei]